jgi:hypothetical protein
VPIQDRFVNIFNEKWDANSILQCLARPVATTEELPDMSVIQIDRQLFFLFFSFFSVICISRSFPAQVTK